MSNQVIKAEKRQALLELGKKLADIVVLDNNLYNSIITIMNRKNSNDFSLASYLAPPYQDNTYIMTKNLSDSKSGGFFISPSYVLVITTDLTRRLIILKIRVNPGYETAKNFDELLPFLEFNPVTLSDTDPSVWTPGPTYYKSLQNSLSQNLFLPKLQGGRTKKYNKSKRSKQSKRKQTRRRK